MLRTWRRTTATDMYAVGITLLELVLHDAAYCATNLSQYETNGYYDINAVGFEGEQVMDSSVVM